MSTPEMSLAVQEGQLGFLGPHQFWTSANEQDKYFDMMQVEHNVLHKLCHLVIQHNTTVQHESEAVKRQATLSLFNKILSIAVAARYEGLPTPPNPLQEPDLPSKSFTLAQLEAEIHLRFRESPNMQLTAEEVTRIKQSAIKRQQYQYVLCDHMACSLLTGCVFDDRREDFVAAVDNGMFLRAKDLARKDIQWRDAGLWTAKYTDDRLTRYLALYIKVNAASGQPEINDSLRGLRSEQRKAIELHSTIARGNTPKGIPIDQPLLDKIRDCLRRIVVDLNGVIETEDARASVEAVQDAPADGQASEEPASAPPEQDANLETGNGKIVLDQPAIAKVLTAALDQNEQPVAQAPQETPHHAVGTVAIAAHIQYKRKRVAEQDPEYQPPDELSAAEQVQDDQAPEQLLAAEPNQDGQTSEELVRTFPAEYLINGVSAHRLSDRQSREIIHSTFSDGQRESIRQGNVSGHAARRDPFVGVRDEDVREEVREFAHGPMNTIEGVPANGRPRRDIPWSDAVDESMFWPGKRTSTGQNQTGMELEVDEASLRNPEKGSFEDAFGE